MLIEQPLELKESGRWRMVQTSDEDKAHLIELCECEKGHETKESALKCVADERECEQIVAQLGGANLLIDVFFEIECKKQGIKPKDMLIILKQSFIETSLKRRGAMKG